MESTASAELDLAILLACEGEHITVETIPDQRIIDIHSPTWGKISCSWKYPDKIWKDGIK